MAVKFQDYYETLGVQRTAPQEEIQKAYRRLARKHHPDINKKAGSEDTFKRIGEAYEVLKDPEKRKRYDTLGQNWQAGEDFSPPPGWAGPAGDSGPYQFRWSSSSGSNREGFASGFSDFFDTLFGGGGESIFGDDEESVFGGRRTVRENRRASGPARGGAVHTGSDQDAEVEIDLEDAYTGGKRRLTLHDGRSQRSLDVNLPPGVNDGTRLRLKGQGIAGGRSGARGDLYLRVRIRPHKRFRVDGSTLEVDVDITPAEAALGASVEVPVVGGSARVKVPAGYQPSQKIRVRGRGLSVDKNKRGDLNVRFRIVVPRRPTPREQELYEQLGREETKPDRE